MTSQFMNEILGVSPGWSRLVALCSLILCLYPILGAMYWFWGAVGPTAGFAKKMS